MPVPLWIVLSCHGAIALGTMFGGWRIVRTMGNKLTRLQPMGGVCAESAAAGVAVLRFVQGHSESAPPTPSPGASSASAPPIACRPSTGTSPGESCGRGCFTIPGAGIMAMLTYWVVAAVS